ncbi:MAG: LysE family transporter [Pseudomonadota bacterium]|nr:LysE family transporter [Pseudomonadota bacterium]
MLAFINGFGLGFSLILAIGAQNSFVLKQGLRQQHVTLSVLFCACSDALLIAAGVGGMAVAVQAIMADYQYILAIVASSWLFSYAIMHFISAWRGVYDLDDMASAPSRMSWQKSLTTLVILTYVNPHVYLDTVILIGSFSIAYDVIGKWHFALGAMTASFVFFASLGYGARYCSRFMTSRRHWRVLDIIIGIIMLAISAKLLMLFFS